MKFLTLLLLLNAFISTLNAQNITLRVLGKSSYVEYAETNGVILSFAKTEFESEIIKLSDTLNLLGIKNKLTPINKITKSTLDKKRFRIEEDDIDLFDKILLACNDLKIKIEKIYYKIPIHKFEDEDENAILALNNATAQAKIIANNLDYQIDKILNIDDETTFSNPIYDIIDQDSERGGLIIELLRLLNGRSSLYQTEASTPFREGGYNIWVTYNLIPK